MNKNPVPINSAVVPATRSVNRRRSTNDVPIEEKLISTDVTPQKPSMPPAQVPSSMVVHSSDSKGMDLALIVGIAAAAVLVVGLVAGVYYKKKSK